MKPFWDRLAGFRLVFLPQRCLLLLVRVYRFWFKPWLGNACRFEPSCSAYAQQALQRHGAARGAALAGWRLLRCQPWCDGGCDPVPDTFVLPAAGLFTCLKSKRQPKTLACNGNRDSPGTAQPDHPNLSSSGSSRP